MFCQRATAHSRVLCWFFGTATPHPSGIRYFSETNNNFIVKVAQLFEKQESFQETKSLFGVLQRASTGKPYEIAARSLLLRDNAENAIQRVISDFGRSKMNRGDEEKKTKSKMGTFNGMPGAAYVRSVSDTLGLISRRLQSLEWRKTRKGRQALMFNSRSALQELKLIPIFSPTDIPISQRHLCTT